MFFLRLTLGTYLMQVEHEGSGTSVLSIVQSELRMSIGYCLTVFGEVFLHSWISLSFML